MGDFVTAQILVVLLALAVFICLKVIRDLKKELVVEKKERDQPQPYVTLSLENDATQLCVKNIGSAPVQEVTLDHMPFTLALDYVKNVTLHFDPVGVVAPQQTVPLTFKAFDGAYEVKAGSLDFMPHLKRSDFEARIHFLTWNSQRRTTIVRKEGGRIVVVNTLEE